MSIISVVYVPEGIAMAADSRLTGHKDYYNGLIDRFTISDNSQKIFLLKKSNVGISSCGDALIDGKTIADYLRIFEIEQITKDDDIHVIASKLQKSLIPTSATSNLFFFIAGYIKNDAFIYKVKRDTLELMRKGDEYGANWNGEKEAFSKLILKNDNLNLGETQFEWSLMPLKDGIDLAEFIIELTIKYQRFEDRIATCGGDIDVLAITKDYAKFIKHKILKP